MVRLAVIDLGSNAARLAVFERTGDGGLSLAHWERRPARLIEGLEGAGGRLGPQPTARAIDALRELVLRSRRLGVEPIAVTTSAVRDAANGDAFVRHVRTSLGLELRVLSPYDEAYYSYLAVTASLGLADGLIVEVGGGSVQLMAVADGRLERWASVPLGAVRLTEQQPLSDPPREDERRALRRLLTDGLAPVANWPVARVAERPIGSLVGISGALRDLVRLGATDGAPPTHGAVLTAARFRLLVDRVASWTIGERIARGGMEPDRADLVVPALELFGLILERTGHAAITLSLYGIREGIAYELFGTSR